MVTSDPEIGQLILDLAEKKKPKSLPITVREFLENPEDFAFTLFDDADDEGFGYYASSEESDMELDSDEESVSDAGHLDISCTDESDSEMELDSDSSSSNSPRFELNSDSSSSDI